MSTKPLNPPLWLGENKEVRLHPSICSEDSVDFDAVFWGTLELGQSPTNVGLKLTSAHLEDFP